MFKNLGLKNYVIYGFGQIISLATPLIAAPRIIGVCGMENWGRIAVATSVLMILNIFIDFGNLLTGIREISTNQNNPDATKRYLVSTYQLKLITLFCVFLVLSPVLFFLGDEAFLFGFGYLFLVSQAANPIWYFQATEQLGKINLIIFISKGIYLALVFLLINEKTDYIYVFLFSGLSNLIVFPIYLRKIFILNGVNLFTDSFSNAISTFKSEWPLVISNLSISLYTNLPVIIVGHLLGNYQSGVYKIADMILVIFRSYLSVFFSVSFPRFCNTFTVDKPKGLLFLKRINLLNLSGLVLFAIGVATLYFTFPFKEYVSPAKLELIQFCSKFALIPAIIAINIPFYQILLFHSRQKFLSIISITSALLMLVGCYFLTAELDLSGSILSVYIVEIFMSASFVVYYLWSRKKYISF